VAADGALTFELLVELLPEASELASSPRGHGD
jgi:hypothetical protein